MSGTTNSSYEMRAPRRSRTGVSADAWAPSQMELLTQQQIGQLDGSQMLGYHLNARTRQQNAADAYATLANSISQRQTESDNLEARLGAAARIADARNPELAVAFTDVRNMIAPQFQATMDQLPEILPARQTATANYDNARANQANVEAGIAPPQGSTVDRYSLPTQPRAQGVPLDLRVAMANAAGGGGGGSGSRQDPAWARLYSDVMNQAEGQRQQLERAMLTDRGIMDSNGQIVRPEALTPAVREQVRAQVEQQIQATTAARFALIDRQRGLPPGTTQSFVQSNAPRPALTAQPAAPAQPAVPQVTGPGPRAGGAVTPAATPAAAPRVAPNAVSPDRMAQINAVAPPQPGTRRVLVGNEVVYIDNAGAVQRRVPVQ